MSTFPNTECDTCPVEFSAGSSTPSRSYSVFTGTTDPPTSGDYVDNDLYFNTENFKGYVRVGNTWTQITDYTKAESLEGYATLDYVDGEDYRNAIINAVASSTALSTLVGSKVTAAVTAEGLVTTAALTETLKSYALSSAVPSSDSFVTKDYAVATYLALDGDYLKAEDLADYVQTSALASYVTTDALEAKGYLTTASFDAYAKLTDISGMLNATSAATDIAATMSTKVARADHVYTKIAECLASAKAYTASSLSGYAETSDVPSVETSVTKDSVKVPTSGAVYSHVSSAISGAIDSSIGSTPSDDKVPSSLATKTYVDNVAAQAVESYLIDHAAELTVNAPMAQTLKADDTTTFPSCSAVADYVAEQVSGGLVVKEVSPTGTPTFSDSDTAYYELSNNAVNVIDVTAAASIAPMYLNLLFPSRSSSSPANRFMVRLVTTASDPTETFAYLKVQDGITVYACLSPFGNNAPSGRQTEANRVQAPTSKYVGSVVEFVEIGPDASSREFMAIPYEQMVSHESKSVFGTFTPAS